MQAQEQLLSSGEPEARAAAARELAALLARCEQELSGGAAVGFQRASAFASASNRLARLDEDLRPPGLAPIALLERALSVAAQSGDHGVEAYAALKLGERLRDEGRYGEARDVLASAAERLVGDLHTRPLIHLVLAQIARTTGDLGEAQARIDAAGEMLARIPEEWPYLPDLQAAVLETGIRLLLAFGNPDRALIAVRELRELGEKVQRRDLVARAHVQAAHVHHAFGRPEEVEREASRALELDPRAELLLEPLRSLAWAAADDPEKRKEAEERLSRFVAARGTSTTDRLRAWIALAGIALRRGANASALERIEEARAELGEPAGASEAEFDAEIALAALAAEHHLATLEERLTELERSYEHFLERWDRVPPQPGGVGFLQYVSRSGVLDALVRLDVAVHGLPAGAARALEQIQRAQARGSVARAARYRPRGLAAVRAALAARDRGIVHYLPSVGRTHLLAFDADRAIHVELPSPLVLEDLRHELVAACSSPPDAAAGAAGRKAILEHAAARELALVLWPPEVRALARDWRAVRIVGGHLLGYVPFEFLPLSERAFLGDELAVSYLPSMPVGMLLKERAPRAAGELDVVVIAATEPGGAAGDLPRLPFGSGPRAALSEAYARERVRVLSGELAGAASLRAPEVGSARVLQVLAHGLVDLERERTSGLALADGPLWCEDVEGSSAPPLVCLWVCKAAQGALRRGEDGLATLPDAFLAAGALAVVVSPARLEYQPVLELARSFHAHIAAGAPPDEALRLARRELGDGGEHGHPFYSLVHVVGLGDVRALGR